MRSSYALFTFTDCFCLQIGYSIRYGEPWRLYYDPALMSEVDNPHYKLFGKSASNSCRNGSHYDQTSEKFGIVPIAPPVLKAVGIQRIFTRAIFLVVF